MTWVIEHKPLRGLAAVYWNGRVFNNLIAAFGPVEQAARFTTEGEALTAYRGEYRPEGSCCNAVPSAALEVDRL